MIVRFLIITLVCFFILYICHIVAPTTSLTVSGNVRPSAPRARLVHVGKRPLPGSAPRRLGTVEVPLAPTPAVPAPDVPLHSSLDRRRFRRLWHPLESKLAHLQAPALQLVKDSLALSTTMDPLDEDEAAPPPLPVAVAHLLGEIGQGGAPIAAALLQPAVAAGRVSLAEVTEQFGAAVSCIVEGLVAAKRLPDFSLLGGEEEQAENLRQMLVLLAQDWRIILVLLAERLALMRGLEGRPPAEQLRVAQETLEVYAPLAQRFGIWDFKTELEELAFMYRHPLAYTLLQQKMARRLKGMEAALDSGGLAIQLRLLEDDPMLQENNATVTVKGRIKGVYSVWAKMHHNQRPFESIKDLMALRVVLDVPGLPHESATAHRSREAALCYHTMEMVRSIPSLNVQPGTDKVKDFIAHPKPNGYQSLHTVVRWKEHLLEVQVRSRSMDHVAEYGLAAHWVYKDQRREVGALQSYRVAFLAPLRRLPALAPLPAPQGARPEQPYTPAEFLDVVRQELLGKRVLVFTTGGRIVNLAKGARVLDALRYLHPGVPPEVLRAELNGAAAPLWAQLHTGQTLHVAVRPRKGGPAPARP